MPPRAIVLSLEQLSRRCLGCYGHEWIETPNLDRFASRGVVFDHCFASPIPETEFRESSETLSNRLRQQGLVVLRKCESDAHDSDSLCDTAFSRLVAAGEQALLELSRDSTRSWLLCLESCGIGWPGVATSEFVELYADELDEELAADLVAIREIEVAYAALLTQFDHVLGRLLGTVDRLFGDAPPLIVVVAAHGQGVCEEEMLSPQLDQNTEATSDAGSLRDELVHVPLLILGATSEMLGSRRAELVTPADVLPTLSDWFGFPPEAAAELDAVSLLPVLRNEERPWRSELFFDDAEGATGLRNDQFLLVVPALSGIAERDGDEATCALFLKPEDVWQVNDVAAQYPDQVANLRTALLDRRQSR